MSSPLKLTPPELSGKKPPDTLTSILGEVLWHSQTDDPTIDEASEAHFQTIRPIIGRLQEESPGRKLKVLELAAYAHTTGYQLSADLGVDSYVADISPSTLKLGRKLALEKIGESSVKATRAYALDFHELPFDDGSFDLVWISSALHHTWQWQRVVSEMCRVTGNGGFVYLHNEPCRRQLCFYKFRTNRPHDFSEFEKELEDRSLIRTFGEPFLGSRPEALFGMVENQTIDLSSLLEVLVSSGTVDQLTLAPEDCMGPFEHRLVELRGEGQDAVKSHILDQLNSMVLDYTLSAAELGQGFILPSPEEMESLAECVSWDLTASLETKGLEFRKALANIFGAPISVLLRKQHQRNNSPVTARENTGSSEDGIMVAYPDEITKLLSGADDLWPDIQTPDEESLANFFPDTDWTLKKAESGTRVFWMKDNYANSSTEITAPAERILTLVRCYASYPGVGYRLTLCINDKPKVHHDVHRADSLLFNCESYGLPGEFKISLKVEPLEPGSAIQTSLVCLSAIRVCAFSSGSLWKRFVGKLLQTWTGLKQSPGMTKT